MTDRDAHRAAVEAGYASLAGYIEKWGDNKMNIVEQLRRHQCPENKGCNPVVDYCQCALMDSGADEIERLREALRAINRKNDNPAWFNPDIHEIVGAALQQKDSES